EPALADRDELLAVVGDAAAGAAEGERGPDHDREAEAGLHLQRLLHRVRARGARRGEADPGHRLLELLAVLRLVDRLARGADHLHAEALEHALAREVERAVERGLAAHGRQQRVGALLLDDARHRAPGDRLDVGGVGHLRVGHDGGRVGIHQHHPVALLAQRLAGLRARIVELAGLADDNRSRANDQDAPDVSSFGHFYFFASLIIFAKRSNRYPISRGPGLASGCPWKQNAGRSVLARPCSEPSKRDTCVGRRFFGMLFGSTAKPWFWLVITTCPVSRSFTGWLAPWWPNFIFMVFAPEARPISWWPRQMPNTGIFVASRISPIASMA